MSEAYGNRAGERSLDGGRVLSGKAKHWLLLLGVILLGTALRFHALGEDSLWNDEIIQAAWARESLGWIYNQLRPSFEAALGVYILHFVRLVGENEFILRFPGVLYGILSLALIYRLGRQLLEPLTGVLAALLLAVSAFHLRHSQEVHPYTLVVMLSILSLDGFVRTLRRPTWGAWSVWILATALSVYAHPFTIFVFAAEMGTVAILRIGRLLQMARPVQLKRFLLGGMLVVLLWMPEFVPALPDLMTRSSSQAVVDSSAASGAWLPTLLVDPSSLVRELAISFAGTPTNLAVLAILVAVGIFAVWIDRRRAALILCLLVLLLPLTAAPFRSSAALFFPRYFIFMLPAVLIMAARGASALIELGCRWVSNLAGVRWAGTTRAVMLLVMSCLILIVSTSPVKAYYREGTQDWRGLAQYLHGNVGEGDAVIQLWLTQPYSLGWYSHSPEGVQVVNAYELRGITLHLANSAQTWWVFSQRDQHKWLRQQVAGEFDIVVFHGVSVLRLTDTPRDANEALAATLVLLDLEAQVHTSHSDLYYELIADLQQESGDQMA